jgi:hypothetical protein
MTTLRPKRQIVPKTPSRDHRNAAMHLIEAAYWVAYAGMLIIADANFRVFAATAIIAVPLFAISSVMLRARLGILRRR